MNLWHFNTFFCIADLIMMFLLSVRAARLAKLRYPELHFRKVTWETKLYSTIKAVLASLCPVFNLVMFYVLITKDEKIIESTIEEMHQKYLEETHNGDHDVNQSEDRTSV